MTERIKEQLTIGARTTSSKGDKELTVIGTTIKYEGSSLEILFQGSKGLETLTASAAKWREALLQREEVGAISLTLMAYRWMVSSKARSNVDDMEEAFKAGYKKAMEDKSNVSHMDKSLLEFCGCFEGDDIEECLAIAKDSRSKMTVRDSVRDEAIDLETGKASTAPVREKGSSR